MLAPDVTLKVHSAGEASLRGLPLPQGVKLHKLVTHQDDRGAFTEIFRDSWGLGGRPVQWNMVRSEANVLRGVHVHRKHSDYVLMAEGEMTLILHDIRSNSSARGLTTLIKLQSADLHMAVIPVGVAHGFYFPKRACHIYAVTHGFDGSDEFGCHWQDDNLGIRELCANPKLSKRDSTAGSYAQMVDAYRAHANA
jgi:dTDP-4-dehydrorhamnose 3,5-epimerase